MKTLLGYVNWWRVLGLCLSLGLFAATCALVYKFAQLLQWYSKVTP